MHLHGTDGGARLRGPDDAPRVVFGAAEIFDGVQPSAVAVLGGEFVKILVVVLLLGLMVGYYENLHWPAFIFTIIAVANSYFIVLFKRH